jgi:hypothetical protein
VDEHADEQESEAPEEVGAGQDRHQQVAQELAVEVDVVGALVALDDDAEVHLQVADHV